METPFVCFLVSYRPLARFLLWLWHCRLVRLPVVEYHCKHLLSLRAAAGVRPNVLRQGDPIWPCREQTPFAPP